MKIKQTKLVAFLIVGIISSLCFSFLSSPTASAYTCEFSGPNGDGKTADGEKLVYDGGNCYWWGTGEDQGEADYNTTTGKKDICTNGTVLHDDGHCWTLRKKYTDIKPTRNDGSEVPKEVWEWYCDQGDSSGFLGVGGADFFYQSDRHRCNQNNSGNFDGCTGLDHDSVDSNCVAPGMDGQPDLEEHDNLKDQTNNIIQDCEQTQGGTLNRQTKRCEWKTPEACDKRPQGVWVTDEDLGTGSCRLYSDFPSRESCDKVGGEFKITGKNNTGQDVWTCVEPGTDGNTNPDDPNDPNVDCAANPDAPGCYKKPDPAQTVGQCGKAKTVLIPCTGAGLEGIGSVLKLVLNILSVGIGIVAVGGIVYGAILYTSARDNSGQTQQAIGIIRNVVIGLLLYIFMVSILNWLVPGGVVGT